MFAKHCGGEFVEPGIYWRRSTWEFVSIPEDGGTLMGDAGEWYTRAPLPVVLVLGPLMGLLFFFTLPLSGMLVLAPMLAGRLRAAVTSGGLNPAHVAGAGQPGISYLEPRLKSSTPRRNGELKTSEPGKLLDLGDRTGEKGKQAK